MSIIERPDKLDETVTITLTRGQLAAAGTSLGALLLRNAQMGLDTEEKRQTAVEFADEIRQKEINVMLLYTSREIQHLAVHLFKVANA